MTAHLEGVSARWSGKSSRAFPSEGVRAIDVDLGPALDRIRVVVRARDAEAAGQVAAAVRGYVFDLGTEIRVARTAEDAAGNALIEALQKAQLRIDASTVTLHAALPPMWAALVLGHVASQVR